MGKSTAWRNMPIDSTLLINAERKTLPFPHHKKVHQLWPETTKEIFEALSDPKYLNSTKLKYIGLDSFSAFTDMLMAEARILRTGYDVFNYYNENIAKLFKLVKAMTKAGKHVIFTCHDEVLMNDSDTVKRIKVKGKEWEGMVEKEFDVVLYATVRVEANAEPKHLFKTRTDGKIPAKAPMGYLDPEMDNDLFAALELIDAKDNA
jgi:hypothetical protein